MDKAKLAVLILLAVLFVSGCQSVTPAPQPAAPPVTQPAPAPVPPTAQPPRPRHSDRL